ncbi:MAG: octanoyltransferase [Bdellovibrionales bacterium CG10_big_fil_rev_8_21_14_0_10_45_34]|nr:MAG: octanoyltransferase [Bdellovibrionales bacterium CG10_big_fil_rev_8_21_14_0_10_45_34]
MRIHDLGLIDYREANELQLNTVSQVRDNPTSEVIYFCQHPSVVTLGRGTKPGDVFNWHGQIEETERGGRATYHGQGQIVCYPILDLRQRGRDIHKYLRSLEQTVLRVLGKLDLLAARVDGSTGVWVGEKKVASIGIAVRHWISFHGVALNFKKDNVAFEGMNPCGFNADVMSDLSTLLQRDVSYEEVKELWIESLKEEYRTLV